MPVIGMSLNSIEAKRTGELKGQINMSSTPQIKDIKKSKLESMKTDVLNIDFDYTCSYTVDGKKPVAAIEMKGSVLFLSDKIDDIVKDWKKNKLHAEIAVPVLNNIIRKCSIRTMQLADELGLPSPVRLPKVSTKPAEK